LIINKLQKYPYANEHGCIYLIIVRTLAFIFILIYLNIWRYNMIKKGLLDYKLSALITQAHRIRNYLSKI